MLKRQDACLLLGVVAVILGGALFFNFSGNEPLWVEWLLGPLVVAVGLVVAIVGVALRCYAADEAAATTSSGAVAKPIH